MLQDTSWDTEILEHLLDCPRLGKLVGIALSYLKDGSNPYIEDRFQRNIDYLDNPFSLIDPVTGEEEDWDISSWYDHCNMGDEDENCLVESVDIDDL